MPLGLSPNIPKQLHPSPFWPSSMEGSTHSSMIGAPSSKDATPSSEESGWTMYFDDFIPSGHGESGACPGFYRGNSSSLVSDAASHAAWKLLGSAKPSTVPAGSFKKLSFKKRKTGAVLDDDSLEDTASSPVNSPKVSDLKRLDMISRKKDGGDMNIHQKEAGFGDCSDPRTDERNDLYEDGHDCTELKRRGLCLVPSSMLVNYFE